jgi:hypothetical protein
MYAGCEGEILSRGRVHRADSTDTALTAIYLYLYVEGTHNPSILDTSILDTFILGWRPRHATLDGRATSHQGVGRGRVLVLLRPAAPPPHAPPLSIVLPQRNVEGFVNQTIIKHDYLLFVVVLNLIVDD